MRATDDSFFHSRASQFRRRGKALLSAPARTQHGERQVRGAQRERRPRRRLPRALAEVEPDRHLHRGVGRPAHGSRRERVGEVHHQRRGHRVPVSRELQRVAQAVVAREPRPRELDRVAALVGGAPNAAVPSRRGAPRRKVRSRRASCRGQGGAAAARSGAVRGGGSRRRRRGWCWCWCWCWCCRWSRRRHRRRRVGAGARGGGARIGKRRVRDIRDREHAEHEVRVRHVVHEHLVHVGVRVGASAARPRRGAARGGAGAAGEFGERGRSCAAQRRRRGAVRRRVPRCAARGRAVRRRVRAAQAARPRSAAASSSAPCTRARQQTGVVDLALPPATRSKAGRTGPSGRATRVRLARRPTCSSARGFFPRRALCREKEISEPPRPS